MDDIKKRSIVSCKLWKSAGRPRSGHIYHIYRKDKAAYKSSIRKRQREAKEAYTNCHDTVSRLVVVYCIGSGGHLYIFSNLAVYRSPHSIGPFEYEVSAWRPLIGQTLVCVFARFARCP